MSRRHDLGRLALAGALSVIAGSAWAQNAPAPSVPRPPRPLLPLEHTLINPDWGRRPTEEDVMRFYPPLALKLKLSGATKISCGVSKAGELQGCVVSSEIPAGFGFGAAAVALTGLMRMTPQLVDGEPTDGGKVVVPINFTYAAAEDHPRPEVEAAPREPSAAALGLGRRLAAAEAGGNGAHLAVEAYLAGLRTERIDGEPSAERNEALEAIEAAEAALASSRRETMARLYAAVLSPADLSAIVTFMESPAGRAWTVTTSTLQGAAAAGSPSLAEPVVLDARDRLCRRIPCTARDTPTATPTQPPTAPQGRASGGAERP